MSSISLCLATAFVVFYALRLWLYTPAYKDRLTYAKYNYHNFPNSFTCCNWIGLMYKDQGRRYEALGWFFDGLAKRELDFRLLFNSAALLGELGRLKDAHTMYEKAKHSFVPDMLEKKMTTLCEEKQLQLEKMMKKQEMANMEYILTQAKRLKRGEKL